MLFFLINLLVQIICFQLLAVLNNSSFIFFLDEQGVEKSMHLKVKDAFSLHHSRKRVLIEWNGSGQPIGESGGLLGGVLGLIASNFNNFSIMYKTWHKVPMQYKDAIFENTIKVCYFLYIFVLKNIICYVYLKFCILTTYLCFFEENICC